MGNQVLTADQIRSKFRMEGRSLSSWAHEHGYPPVEVYKLLNGQAKGHRGRGHEIAVALGIKPDPAKTRV